jgi:hypothetical protein
MVINYPSRDGFNSKAWLAEQLNAELDDVNEQLNRAEADGFHRHDEIDCEAFAERAMQRAEALAAELGLDP